MWHSVVQQCGHQYPQASLSGQCQPRVILDECNDIVIFIRAGLMPVVASCSPELATRCGPGLGAWKLAVMVKQTDFNRVTVLKTRKQQ